MKGLKRILFGMAAFLILTAGGKTRAAEEYYPDPTQPFATITDMSISSKTVRPGDTLKYSLVLNEHDTASYFVYTAIHRECTPETIAIRWESPDGKQKTTREYGWEETKVGNKHIIKDEIKINKGRSPGVWKVTGIWICEVCLDSGEDDSEYLYIENATTGVTKEDYTYTDMSALDFTVKGTKADRKAPKASYKSMKLSKKKVKENEKVKFSVKVTDQSQIKSVSCRWNYAPDRTKKHDEYYAEEVYYDYEMKYNKKTKAYECILRGGSGKKSLMYLESISVEDEYGNRTWYASYNRGKKWKKWKKAIKKMVFYRK